MTNRALKLGWRNLTNLGLFKKPGVDASQVIFPKLNVRIGAKIHDIALIFVKALSVAAVRKTPALLEPSSACGRRFVQRPCRKGILSC